MVVNETAAAGAWTMNVFFPAVVEKTVEIIKAPVINRDTGLLWIITPLIITMFLMEFYFGRYNKEELGWNSAVANSLVLIFVSVDLFRYIYGGGNLSFDTLSNMTTQTFIACIVAINGIWFLYVNFFHILPKRFAFIMSSALPINLIAYISIIFVYTNLLEPPTNFNLIVCMISAIILAIMISVAFTIMQWLIPKSADEILEESFEELVARRRVGRIEQNIIDRSTEIHHIPRPSEREDDDFDNERIIKLP